MPDVSGVVGVVPTVLIISQMLYLGAAAGLYRNFKKWRHHSREIRVVGLFILLPAFSVVQSVLMFVREKDDELSNALMIAGPLPILAPSLAMMLYPLSESSMRWKYRKGVAKWDSHIGNFIPIWILCNTWWKWAIYLATTAATFFVTGYAYHKSGNLYPLLTSIALPVMTILLRAQLPLRKRIEDLQSECRGNCEDDVIVVPILGHSASTSVIILTYDKRNGGITIERRQSIVAHTNFGGDHLETTRSVFRKRFSGSPGDAEEFVQDARKLIQLVANVGGWFTVSPAFLEDRHWVRQQLNNKEVYNGYNTAMFCWTRSILESAIRVGCSRQKEEYDLDENLCVRDVSQLFSFITGEAVGHVEIADSNGVAISGDDVGRMLAVIKDARGAFVVAALLLERMSLSKDARSAQLMTLGKGYDITVKADRKTGEVNVVTHSEDIVLDVKRLHGDLVQVSAPDRIRMIGEEDRTVADKALHEIISGEFVPMNWTSFCIHRQHMLMNLLSYMGLAVIFIVFGQTQSTQSIA